MILDPALTGAYIVLAAALAVSPGPDVLFVIANGMRHRARGAVASALGICAGSVLHAFAAALGISALIAASPFMFDLLRYAGAAYLAWLGLQAVRSWWVNREATYDGMSDARERKHGPVRAVFRQGLITNILNPKVVIFYLALLPQFVNVDLGHVGLQIFLLGCIHNLIGLIFLLTVGCAAGKASSWLAKHNFARWLDGFAGLFFIGLAVRLAVTGRPQD